MQKGKLLLGPENQSTIPEDGIKYLSSKGTVHDTENLTFSEEFCGWFVRNDADLPQGGRRSSAQADMNFPQIRVENGRNQKANFVCNNNGRIEKDIARIVQIILVGLDSLSLSSTPVELGWDLRRYYPRNLCKYEKAQQISATAYYIRRILHRIR